MSSQGKSRPALLRVMQIATQLREQNRAWQAAALAAEFAVSEKTIQRDLDLLKDLGAPIYFDYAKCRWQWNAALPVPWYFGGTIANPILNRSNTTNTHHTYEENKRAASSQKSEVRRPEPGGISAGAAGGDPAVAVSGAEDV